MQTVLSTSDFDIAERPRASVSATTVSAPLQDAVVSFDNEPLILVDKDDREIGCMPKVEAHRGSGFLHRAFSILVFDDAGRLLMQRRARSKRLWPDHWSNTCCSHPRLGEDIDSAVHRRLDEELRLRCSLEFLFKFQYQAQFDVDGAENELCWVYGGRCNDAPYQNHNEVSELRFIEPAVLDREMRQSPEDFTPWFQLEWARVCRDHPQFLLARSQGASGSWKPLPSSAI